MVCPGQGQPEDELGHSAASAQQAAHGRQQGGRQRRSQQSLGALVQRRRLGAGPEQHLAGAVHHQSGRVARAVRVSVAAAAVAQRARGRWRCLSFDIKAQATYVLADIELFALTCIHCNGM